MDEEQKKLAEELLFSGPSLPSFAKSLYFGRFDHHRVMPFPQPTDTDIHETNQLIEELEEWANSHLDGDAIDRNAEIPQEVIRYLGDKGILGLTVPREYGGEGKSQYTYCRAAEFVARSCASTALFINAHQSIGLKALLLFGSEEQKKCWLPDLASGKKLAAFSLTEPNAGSDASGIETRAVYDAEKGVYRINGNKQWTTNGAIADVLTLMAQTEVDGEDKVTAFLVTPDMPGFTVTDAALEKVGMRGTKTANLAFKDMEVPKENILGPLGGGLKVCLTVLNYGRTTFAATCTGAAKTCVERAIQHATTRHQFGYPLAHFELVKQKIATMSAKLYAMEAATYMTAGLIDKGQDDVMLESAIIKVFCSDALWEILYDTMQIFGGRSFFTDHPFERMMRDARLNMIGEGSNEVMRPFIGLVGMRDVGKELEGAFKMLSDPINRASDLCNFAWEQFGRLASPEVTVRSSLLAPDARRLSRQVRRFGLAVVRVLARYKEGVVDRQLDLDRIATAAMSLYTQTAALSLLDTQLRDTGSRPEPISQEIASGTLYFQMASRQFDQSLASLFDSLDAKICAASETLCKPREQVGQFV